MDDNRRQALSRARGIANEQGSACGLRYCLQGISAGDVLDWTDAGLFLAVIGTTAECLYAQGVMQAAPWGAVRDIRMAPYPLFLRLRSGQIEKVAALRR